MPPICCSLCIWHKKFKHNSVKKYIYNTRNTCIAEPREARGEPIKGAGGGQESNEVNHITGEGGSNIGSCDVLNLLWIKSEPSALALERIF